jgi:iron-sulfur cluster assembly accessory protein
MTITLSANAWKRLRIISKMSVNNVYYNKFLLSVKSGGCNGFTYNFSPIVNETFVKITNKKPIIVNNNDISVILDPKSELILSGTHIDFEKGDYEEKFIFSRNKDNSNDNSNKVSNCGCGKSFSIS